MNESQLVDGGGLQFFWIVGNGRLSMMAIVSSFNIPKKIPTEASLQG
jgi:hypothetical protein